MSQDDVSIVERAFAAVSKGDEGGLLALVHDDVDWWPSAFLTGTGHYEGPDGISRWFADLRELTSQGSHVLTFTNEFDDLGGGRVLVLGRGILARDVGDIEQELGWIWEVHDGRVASMRNFLSHAEAREAVGES